MAREAPLPSIVTASKPSVSFSTRKPLTWPSSSERAHTTTTSAIEPLPIQRLAPSSTQSSPSRRALVSSATESEPCSGSVSANAPIASSRAIAGSQRSFCSSEPSRSIDFIASPDCTPRNVPRLPSPRWSSMFTRPRASGLIPGQPCPWMSSPSRPSSARRRISGHGSSAASQYSLITGSTSRSTKRRVAMKCSHCSSLNCSRTWK